MGRIYKKNYTTEMDAKQTFNGLLGAFLFGDLLPFVLFTVKPDVFLMGTLQRCGATFRQFA